MTSTEQSIFAERTLNFAHRGFTASAPENTMLAFRNAVELGVDGVELDVRTCASGEVVVFHDATLERLTDSSGSIKEKSLSELRELRIGGTDEGIPLLDEVIEEIGAALFLNVEIKADGLPANHQIEQKVIDCVRRHDIADKTVVSSFNPLMVRKIRKIDDVILNGFLIDKGFNVRKTEIFFSRMAGARAIHPHDSLAKEKLLSKISQRGFLMFIWTVNDPQRMATLIQNGVNGIITDKPDLLQKVQNEILH